MAAKRKRPYTIAEILGLDDSPELRRELRSKARAHPDSDRATRVDFFYNIFLRSDYRIRATKSGNELLRNGEPIANWNELFGPGVSDAFHELLSLLNFSRGVLVDYFGTKSDYARGERKKGIDTREKIYKVYADLIAKGVPEAEAKKITAERVHVGVARVRAVLRTAAPKART